MSSVLHYEARGESYEGKVAVASVVMNRVESSRFPNTVCGVVKQRKQFSWYPRQRLRYGNQRKFATKFLNNKIERTVPTSYFFTSGNVRLRRPVTKRIGGHLFYGL